MYCIIIYSINKHIILETKRLNICSDIMRSCEELTFFWKYTVLGWYFFVYMLLQFHNTVTNIYRNTLL